MQKYLNYSEIKKGFFFNTQEFVYKTQTKLIILNVLQKSTTWSEHEKYLACGKAPTDPLTLKHATSQSNKDFTTDVSKVCRFLRLSEWKQCDSKHPSKWQTDSTVTTWERSTSFRGKGIRAEAPHCNATQWSGLRILLSSCWRPLGSNDVFSSNRKQTHCCLPTPITEKRATTLIPRVSHKFQPHPSFPLFRFLQCLQKGRRQG